MNDVESPVAGLAAELGYEFRTPGLLQEALTHPSATDGAGSGRRNMERLEFLGDRVLGLVVADLLVEAYPDETVGQIARRHAALVSGAALARVARQIGLGDAIVMSRGEEEQGGRSKPRTLGDCCEAVVAAVYLDGGPEAAGRIVRRYWLPMMREEASPPRDPKTGLQEWAQARGLALPVYTVLRREGAPHAPVFEVECAVDGLPPERAEGRSRRAAERAAAGRMLDAIADRGPDDG